jgi:hypothetical protein
MRIVPFNPFVALLLTAMLAGCTLPQIIKPLNLYDINNGAMLALTYLPTSQDHGTISSAIDSSRQFHGECIFSNERGYPRPTAPLESFGKADAAVSTPPKGFAEAYGFSKDLPAKPVGTGIVVGNDGTVIELVFYHWSSDARSNDLQTADGVGRDNNGRYYRVFLSTQSQ